MAELIRPHSDCLKHSSEQLVVYTHTVRSDPLMDVSLCERGFHFNIIERDEPRRGPPGQDCYLHSLGTFSKPARLQAGAR